MSWVRLIEWNRCAVDQGVFVEAAGRELAVFRLSCKPHLAVIDNTCPHAGGNLSGGVVQGTTVTCPWHEWPFDITSGMCTLSAKASVKTYPCETRDGFVWADLGPREHRNPHISV